MTELTRRTVRCACGHLNNLIFHTTINLGMYDEEALVKLMQGQHGTKQCENCGETLRVNVEVLIVGPRGSFHIDNWEDPGKMREILVEQGVDLDFVEREARSGTHSYGLIGPPYFRRAK